MRTLSRIGWAVLLGLHLAGAGAVASSYEQATAAMRSGDFATAARLLEETIDASPPWAAGHVALAQCRFMLGQPGPAEASLAKALEIDPDAPLLDAYAFAGLKLYGERRYDEAIAPLAQALERAPEARAEGLSTRLANALFQAGEYAEARDRLRQHQQRFGFDAGMAYFLALSLEETGEPGAAIEALERALEGGLDERREARAVERLARWSRDFATAAVSEAERKARTAAALTHARRWRDRTPDDETAFRFWFNLARSSGDLPEYDDAMARLSTIGAEHDSPESVLEALEQLDRVRESLGEAVRREPSLKSRVDALNDRLAVTETALDEALKSLDDDARRIAAILEQRTLDRCKIVHWNLKTDRAAVSDADRAFYDENDCRERVRRDSGG